jgi:hypothetical protein
MYWIVAGNLPLAAGSLVVTHLRSRTATTYTPFRSKLATFQIHMSGTVAR